MSKVKTTPEDYLSLLFLRKPELIGEPIEKVREELNKEFDTNFSHKFLSLIYEPLVDYNYEEETIEEEEDFYNGY